MANTSTARPFTNGVYCPLITPFKPETEELDYEALTTQVVRLAKVHMGIVLLGTNGEANHLSDEERSKVISISRDALDKNGFTNIPLLVGTGTGSAKETIKLTTQAKAAGADYAIVISPGYFSFAMGRDKAALKRFFIDVLDKSPLPVMIYNFPGAASGIDFDSDFLIDLSEHQNCFGAKLTCAGIGKGHRLSAHTQSEAYKKRHPTPFFVMPGFSDYLLPAVVSRASGCITGTGNIIPKTIVKLYEASVKAVSSGSKEDLDKALELQDIVSDADWVIIKAGIGGTKYALDKFVQPGLGGVPRAPLPLVGEEIKALVDNGMKRVIEFENSL
ncbi:putative dihydrodipicolinate synthase [Cylindrobasidium torrendii FP15055 ss-10]|uniref:Putative dihydrodipicolinate synthase n=1 Tax=Cylindrobasidium torrendii FP15055 ss-10 TaxID=1314674 RepID=A0A0D7B883_9AGAR|nr:putative dihydrodipicolinate synthase [Cylindrobasidium torrendii FP15055 ss-10]